MIRKGIYLSFLTAIISGFSIFSNKLFVTKADPLVFTVIRNTVVGIILTILLLFSKKTSQLKFLNKKDWIKLTLIGLLGGSLPFALFFMGLAQIGGITGNLIHKSLFIWVALLAIPILGERLSKKQLLGYALVIIASFAFTGMDLSISLGTLMVLAATVLWAIENVIAKIVLRSVSSEIVSWARIVLGIPILYCLTFILGKGNLLLVSQSYSWQKILTSSAFLVAYVLTWYKALSLIPATLASSILVIAPLVTTFLTVVFITHALPDSQTFPMLLISLGITLIISKATRSRPKAII